MRLGDSFRCVWLTLLIASVACGQTAAVFVTSHVRLEGTKEDRSLFGRITWTF